MFQPSISMSCSARRATHVQEKGPILSCQESDGLGKNIMHPKPYILTLQHHFSSFMII